MKHSDLLSLFSHKSRKEQRDRQDRRKGMKECKDTSDPVSLCSKHRSVNDRIIETERQTNRSKTKVKKERLKQKQNTYLYQAQRAPQCKRSCKTVIRISQKNSFLQN
jgi:hypothetical protein